MRILMIFCIFYLLHGYAIAQTTGDNIYYTCFERHISAYYQTAPVRIYLLESDIITEYIPSKISNTDIKKVNDKDIVSMTRNKGMVIIQVQPIIIESGKIYLNIIEYSVFRKKGKVNYVKHGGSYFEIGPVDGRYVIVGETHTGV